MIKRGLVFLFLLALTLAACAPAMSSSPPAEAPSAGFGAPEMDVISREDTGSSVLDVTDQSQAERLVIKNASLSIAVPGPLDAMESISQMAEEMGGFVVTSNSFKATSSSGLELPEANITIRVPAERLDEALERIKALVVDQDDILTENVTGQDVTKDYTDLKSRLVNLENTEKQLQEIMDEASKTEDVLAVYNQLVSVREQIEVLKGQIKYYEEFAALSMIQVRLQSKEAIEPLSIGSWKPVGVARDALQATLNGLKFLGTAAIWIVLFLIPIALVIILPLWLLFKLIRRTRKNRKLNSPAAMPPTTPEGS